MVGKKVGSKKVGGKILGGKRVGGGGRVRGKGWGGGTSGVGGGQSCLFLYLCTWRLQPVKITVHCALLKGMLDEMIVIQ